jgi:serine phosphatase RsbU (regulator of sigma subunit)
MSETPVETDSTTEPEDSSEDLLRTLAALGAHTGGTVHAASNFNALVRAASRHLRRLSGAARVRIWITRRSGRRLEGREFPADEAAPVLYRAAQGEGLAGYCVEHGETLRLNSGDSPPTLRGELPEFRNAVVVPLFRRGDVFGAVEFLDKLGGKPFRTADLDPLEAASEQVAFALDNALLYEDSERRSLEKEVLLEVSRALAAPLDLDEVFRAIFDALREVVKYDAAAIYLVNKATQNLEVVSATGFPEGSDDAFKLQVGQGLVGWVAKTGEPVIVPDVLRDPRYVAARPETRSELAAPLTLRGRTLGVFNLERDIEDAYHEGHLELLMAFAAQAAVALERARMTRELLDRRRLEKELAIARDIQLSFLPGTNPQVPGFDVAGTSRAHDEVGGDYYDFIPVSDTRLGLAIADVSGKGIPAALLMAGFRMSLLAEIRNEFAIRAVMRKVGTLLFESTERDRFVTAFYGVLDYKNRVLIFSNAGHDPPILLRADGTIEYLMDGGVALGVLADARYEERPIALMPGDVLVMYTDGVSEAAPSDGPMFGHVRIEETARRLAGLSSAEILNGIVEAVVEWAGERGPSDDLTLVVVKVKPDAVVPAAV